MPIDKRKMTDSIHQHSCLTWRNPSSNTIYFLLIFISLAWNAYNTYQYQILIERQSKLESILNEISPMVSDIQATSSTEQWFTKVFAFLRELTSTNDSSNAPFDSPNKVRFVFLEMLFENLDTCVWIYAWFLSRLFSHYFQHA